MANACNRHAQALDSLSRPLIVSFALAGQLLCGTRSRTVIVQQVVHPVQVTLLDSTKKKCAFLEEVAADLQLRNVHVVWQRAEEAGHTASLREAGGNP